MVESRAKILVTRSVLVVMCLLFMMGSLAGCGIIDQVGWQSEPSEPDKPDEPNDPERGGDWLRPDRSDRSSRPTPSSPEDGS